MTVLYARRCTNKLADDLNAAPIQHIGKLLVFWRPQPDKGKRSMKTASPSPDVKVLKFGPASELKS